MRQAGQRAVIANEMATVGLAKGGQPYQATRVSEKPASPPTLAEAGIDKNLATKARKAVLLHPAGGVTISTAAYRSDFEAAGNVLRAALIFDPRELR